MKSNFRQNLHVLCTGERKCANHLRPENPQNLTIHIKRMPEKNAAAGLYKEQRKFFCILDLSHVLNYWIQVNIHQTPGLQEKSCNFFLVKIEVIFSHKTNSSTYIIITPPLKFCMFVSI